MGGAPELAGECRNAGMPPVDGLVVLHNRLPVALAKQRGRLLA
jgi:hypothetical protein